MLWNEKEKEILREKLKRIEHYVTEKFIPQIRKNEAISVKFCAEYTSTGTLINKDYKHSFGFNGEGRIWYTSGGLTLYFAPPKGYEDNTVYKLSYTDDLLLNWTNVKHLVEEELARMNKKRETILSLDV